MMSRLTQSMGMALVTAMTLAVPAQGQWSSNIPGVPRASIPIFGSSQGRFEFDLTGVRGVEGADSLGGRLRLGFGTSWRIASAFELGYDLTLGEFNYIRVPGDTLEDREASNRLVGGLGYGLKVGLKVRPISYLTPEGYGFDVALGAAYQPALEPALTFHSDGDSLLTGGVGGASGPTADSVVSKVSASTLLMAAVSYANPRVLADVSLVSESARSDGLSPLLVYDGISIRSGVRVRLTPGFALGASYWGKGAPPWRDRLARGLAMSGEPQQFGLLLGFGSTPGKGTDLVISSPTGDFGRTLNLYWRIR